MIFHGAPGTGKFLAALEFARALNCSHTAHREKPPAPPQPDPDDLFAAAAPPPPAPEPEPEPVKVHTDISDSCGACISCLQAACGAHPDIRVVDTEMQAALFDEDESANLKIDTMREMTRWAQQKPLLSPWKVFIIRDAEAMVTNAQNAILKTLEEPPPGTIVIMTVSRKTSLLPTILSRSCMIEFGPLPRGVLGHRAHLVHRGRGVEEGRRGLDHGDAYGGRTGHEVARVCRGTERRNGVAASMSWALQGPTTPRVGAPGGTTLGIAQTSREGKLSPPAFRAVTT